MDLKNVDGFGLNLFQPLEKYLPFCESWSVVILCEEWHQFLISPLYYTIMKNILVIKIFYRCKSIHFSL